MSNYFIEHSYFNEKKVLLEKIENVLSGNNTNLEFNNKISDMFYYENDCLSLYDISCYLKNKVGSFNECYDYFKNVVVPSCEKYGFFLIECSESGGYNKEVITITFKHKNSKFIFKFTDRGDGIEILSPSDMFNWYDGYSYSLKEANDIFSLEKEKFSILYNKFILQSYLNDSLGCHSYIIDSVNSPFSCDFVYGNMQIFLPSMKSNSFKLEYITKSDNYRVCVNSNDVVSFIKGKEEEILKKIFVNIEDCPNWFMREELYQIKDKILEEEDKKLSDFQTEKHKKCKNQFLIEFLIKKNNVMLVMYYLFYEGR